jgi:ribosomal protein S6E (S10)
LSSEDPDPTRQLVGLDVGFEAAAEHTEDSFPKDRFRTSMLSFETNRDPFPMRLSVEGPLRVDMLSAGRDFFKKKEQERKEKEQRDQVKW